MYAGDGDRKVIGLVGKGLTFDSGGYNLKVGGKFLSFQTIQSISGLPTGKQLATPLLLCVSAPTTFTLPSAASRMGIVITSQGRGI